MTPVALRAPEIILSGQLGKGIDIWSFGCLIFEMLLGRPLFVQLQALGGRDYDETTNDEHLIQLSEVLGLLSPSLFARWRRGSQYFGPDGERIDIDNGLDEYDSVGEEEEDL